MTDTADHRHGTLTHVRVASHVEDPSLERSVREAYLATGGGSDGSEMLFVFDLEHVMLSTYKKRGEPNNWPPIYTKWHAAADTR